MRINFTELRDDRGSVMTTWATYFVGYAVGSLIQGFMQYHNGFDAGKEDQNKLQQVQLENEQVQVQLDSRLQNVSKLVLNDAHKTFTFDMRDVQGQLENCNGTYGDSQAVARADLAHLSCVRSIDITPTATPSK